MMCGSYVPWDVIYEFTTFILDPSQSTCFGGPFGQFLTKYFLGYDMMIIASFKHLLPPNLGK